jgi:peroxiredoxin
MTTHTQKFKAGDPFPQIILPTVGGNGIQLGQPQGNCDWRMIVVYRGKHCGLCKDYLEKLNALKDKFYKIKIDVVAVTADSQEKAAFRYLESHLSFPVAYDLSLDQAGTLGLYISDPREGETDRPFPEPGIFVVNAEGNVQVIDISNAPFARADLDDLLWGLEYIREEGNYPIRGTHE